MALTASDWTVSIEERRIEGKKRLNRVKLTLPTAGTYTASGIDIPSYSDLGMKSRVDYIIITDPVAASVNPVKYDQANKSIRIFVATATAGAHITEVATTVSVGAGGTFIIYAEAVGW